MKYFINRIYKFMVGRYGADELYNFLLIVSLIIVIINVFIDSILLKSIEFLIFVFALYRFFSKNRSKRSKENERYLDILDKIKSFFNYQKKKFKERNIYMYKMCPECKQKLRLPLKKGKHMVKCPSCNYRFSVKCNRNEKIKVQIVR